jgi:hypothetical protein
VIISYSYFKGCASYLALAPKIILARITIIKTNIAKSTHCTMPEGKKLPVVPNMALAARPLPLLVALLSPLVVSLFVVPVPEFEVFALFEFVVAPFVLFEFVPFECE